ncbi:TetR/AcrR family transcriptional regulator [Arsenicicoccus bolidensis]|uniref:TetR/AcrR family transcriptional regulator n=1 Tax=Arsenicicoccus bolidensis TaxID=229480 RepID=UPI000411E95E|nr:TetR/AcrR family transcriptional regulator [Arsenicicoccus bolidensis]
MSQSRELIVRAARRLFAEHGYSSVSVRDVAAEAGVSASLVMKLVGSKAELFSSSVEFAPDEQDLSHPVDRLGHELVRSVVGRLGSDGPEPLARAVVLALPAPDIEQVRSRFHAAYAVPLAARLGGGDTAEQTAEMVVATVVGLAVSARVLGLLGDRAHDEDLVERYGAAVQLIIDRGGASGGSH